MPTASRNEVWTISSEQPERSTRALFWDTVQALWSNLVFAAPFEIAPQNGTGGSS
jgi:hypothetical protein